MAIMTGGATGIGEAIAEWLSHAGATVPIVDQNQRETEALAARLGMGAFAVLADGTSLLTQ